MGTRGLGAVLLIACLAKAAAAQPGPDSQPVPAAPPNYYAPTPQQYAVQITEEERDLLVRGEINDGQIVLGGVAAIFFGFGLGQGVQGRWSDTGWIFTFGEIGSLSLLIAGAIDAANSCSTNCEDDEVNDGVGLIIGGALAFSALRIWESIDAFTGPASHNRRLRALRLRLGYPQYPGYYGLAPYVAPTGNGGGTAGLSLRF